MNRTQCECAPSAPGRASWYRLQRLSTYFSKIPESILSLSARIFIGMIFWQSGRTKVDGWHLSENAIYLFQEEYRLPLIDPAVAAYAAAFAEHVFPALLFLGLGTRVAALALLCVTAVIQMFVYPDAWPTHGSWATILLFLVARGAGAISIDRWIAQRMERRKDIPPTGI